MKCNNTMVGWGLTTLFLCAKLLTGHATCNELIEPPSQCVCSDEIVIFMCKITGGGTTLWRGSLFNCPSANDEVILRHSQFNSGTTGTCNNGNVVGQSLQLKDNCYSSQLSVTASSTLLNTTIECLHDNTVGVVVIGTTMLKVVTEAYSPPSNISLSDINNREVTFTWNHVHQSCTAITYNIVAEDCGTCPTTLNSTSATCFIPPVSSTLSQCFFRVQTVTCGNILGSTSAPVIVNMRVLSAPNAVKVVPLYNATTGNLISFDVNFSEPISFNISSEISGSAESYNITTFDSITNSICDSSIFLASTCQDGRCAHVIRAASFRNACGLPMFGVIVRAINVYGNGLESDILHTEARNVYVSIIPPTNAHSSFTCKFLNESEGTLEPKWCSIMYKQCSDQGTYQHVNVSSNSRSLSLDTSRVREKAMYCYIATASNGIITISTTGEFYLDGAETKNSNTAVIVVIIIIILMVILCTIIIIVVFVHHKKKKLEGQDSELFNNGKNWQDDFTEMSSDRKLTFKLNFVHTDCQLKEFVENVWKLPFKRGCVFYEFIHEFEDIFEGKEVILIPKLQLKKFEREIDALDQISLYTGENVLKKIQAPGIGIKRPSSSEYKIFIQSFGSGARHIGAHTLLLYEDCAIPNLPLIPVHSDHFTISAVENECTLEAFCNSKDIPFNKVNAFPQLGALKEPIKQKNVRDVLIMDETTGQFYSGPMANEKIINAINGGKDMKLSEKWKVFILRKKNVYNQVFNRTDKLQVQSFVLHEKCGQKSPKEQFRCFAVDTDCYLWDFLNKKQLKFESGRVFIKFTNEVLLDLSFYKDVVYIEEHMVEKDEKGTIIIASKTGIEAFYDLSDDLPTDAVKQIRKKGMTIFIACHSQGSRYLKAGDILLYKVINESTL